MYYFKTTFFLFFTLIFCLAATNHLKAQQQTVTVEPEKPTPGETVTITYHPENSAATIKSPDSLNLILSFAPYLYSQPDKFEMKRTANGWKTKFKLSDKFKFASYYFKSGDKTDKNTNGHHFELFAYKDDKPVREAYLMKASSLDHRYKEMSDELLANMKVAMYTKELAIHPDSYNGYINLFTYQLKQENANTVAIRKKAQEVIDQKLATNPAWYPVISDVKHGYQAIGEKAKGDSVQQAMIEKYPKKDIGMYGFYQKVRDQEDEEKRAKMLQEYINVDYNRSFINKYYTERAYQKLFEYYAKQGDLKKAKQMATKWLEQPLLENRIKSYTYNSAAKTIVKHTDSYDLALQYAQTALQKTDKEPPRNAIIITGSEKKIRYIPKEKEQHYKEQRKGEILSTIGHIYLKKEQYKEAEKYLSRAKQLSNSKSARTYMAKLYMETDRPRQAFDVYRDILMEEPVNKEIRNKLKKAYIAYNGSEKGFEKKTTELDKAWREKMVKKFNKERIDKEAPSFKGITDLQGNPIDTEKFQNSILVVDFWATWCGPCISAFPHLQDIYEKYEDHPNVKFVVLNTSWNNTMKDARKWKKKNDYSFPLYFDKKSKITEAFGVRGIPTTFFVGQDGNIQFKKVGFEGPTMEKKMDLQIKLLLEEEKSRVTSSPQK